MSDAPQVDLPFDSPLQIDPDQWHAFAHPDDLTTVSVTDIARAGFSALKLPIPDPGIRDLPDGWDERDPDVILAIRRKSHRYPWVDIVLYRDGRSQILFGCRDDEEIEEEQVKDRAHAILSRQGFAVHNVINDDDDPGNDGRHWAVESRIYRYSHRVRDIWTVARQLSAALKYEEPLEGVTKGEVLRALRSGASDVLLGLRESSWLEFKSILPDLAQSAGPAGRIELAKDVAQFANSFSGGLLIYGVRTKNDGRGDVARKFTPLLAESRQLTVIRDIVDRRIYPSIQRMRIDYLAVKGGHLLLFEVPPQSSELKPFIVEGAVIGGAALESAFLIPQRIGDRIIPVAGRELHGLIAGKLFAVDHIE